MALIERLSGEEKPKIAVHTFWSCMVELALGEMTVQSIVDYFNMDAATEGEFLWLVGEYQGSANKERFLELMHALFMLAESNVPGYETTQKLASRIGRIG